MYSKAFRTLMVQKMTVPDRPDVESLSAEVVVPQSTLYRWVADAGNLIPKIEVAPSPTIEQTQRQSKMKRPQDWSADRLLPYRGSHDPCRLISSFTYCPKLPSFWFCTPLE
jgi:hypothetical protein